MEKWEDKCSVKFITNNMDDISFVAKTIDYDEESNVANVSYRLDENTLLSIYKPEDAMDDTFVLFSVFCKKELILQQIADISLVKKYIDNVQNMIKSE